MDPAVQTLLLSRETIIRRTELAVDLESAGGGTGMHVIRLVSRDEVLVYFERQIV
jgi:hypothetical protein